MEDEIPQTKFEFAEACIRECPLVHKAICVAIGKQAILENDTYVSRREVAAEIDNTFRHPLGFGYNVNCNGPKSAKGGTELRCGRTMHSRGGV